MKPLSRSSRKSLEAAVAAYQRDVSLAERYLKARGIDQEWAENFRLGVVADPLPGHERFVGRLAIPSLCYDGHPVSLRFRCLEDHDCREAGHPKYLGMGGVDTRLFNPRALHAEGDVIGIAEGEIDAISLNIAGIPAVGVTGAMSWKEHHPRCFAGYPTVLVFADSDPAGDDFATNVSRSIVQGARVVRMKHGFKDVNDLLVAEGPDAIRELIRDEDDE